MTTNQSKVKAGGHKSVTTQIVKTAFGDIRVEIGVAGYKSSEGDVVYQPPSKGDNLDGAEAQTGEAK